jgi:ABC-2 type transport system ATP-binding protein
LRPDGQIGKSKHLGRSVIADAADPKPSGVFISYCHRDQATAIKLEQLLSACHVPVRIDRTRMRLGEPIRDFIQESIRFTQTTLWIVSEHSLLSDWVGIEIATTLSDATLWKQRRLIACYLDDAFLQPEFQLNATRSIDARLSALGRLIPCHDQIEIGTKNLDGQKAQLRDLRNSLDALLDRLRTMLCVDLRDANLDTGLEQLVAELAPTYAGGLWRALTNDIEQRRDQIYALIGTGDGDRAFNRLMDFVRDFSRNAEHKRSVALIRWNFSTAKASNDDRAKAECVKEAFVLLDVIMSAGRARTAELATSVTREPDSSRDERNTTAAEQVRRAILADPQAGVRALVALGNRSTTSAVLRQEALLLKLTVEGASSREESNALQRKMLDLLTLIENGLARDSVGLREPGLAELRQYYLDRPIPNDLIVRAGGLRKRYTKSDFTLKEVDLLLHPGEITAVVGQNAHGKTTLLRIVAGELRADAGKLEYPGLTRGDESDWYAIKSQIAYLPQELPPWHGALVDNLQYEAALHGLLGQDNEDAVKFFIERLQLHEHLDKRWQELSGGTKLRFALARVLTWKPKLLILDEPLANLDVLAQSRFLQNLRDLAQLREAPLAVLLSSQHLHELEVVASRIVFLQNGGVKFNGTVAEIGAERSCNVYELGSTTPISALRDLFGVQHGEPFHNGLGYVIKTPLELQASKVLERLLSAGVSVQYFRDLSCSIKSLFEH